MQELEIREIIDIIIHNLFLIIICTLGGLLAAFLVSTYIIPPKYTSSVSLYVNNSTESILSSALNINDINASQKLVNTYIVILQDDEVLDEVGARLMKEYTISQLEDALPLTGTLGDAKPNFKVLNRIVSLSSVNNTEVLNIEVTTKDAVLSARICNIITEVAPEVLTRVVKAGSVEVIGSAKPAESPSSPNIMLNSLIGAMVGLALSVGGVLLGSALDNTVGTEEDLKKRYNIPLLGEVPDFAMNPKGAYKSYGKPPKDNEAGQTAD